MATWTPGVPYTSATEDQVTTQVNADRVDTEEPASGAVADLVAAGTDIDTYPFPSVSIAGITGSVAGMRQVGANATGPPTTGAHIVGDRAISQAGQRYVCITAGTPGTWLPDPGMLYDTDLGAVVTATVAATTLFATAMNALASPRPRDLFILRASGQVLDFGSGAPRTSTLTAAFAGTALFTTAPPVAVNSGESASWDLESRFQVPATVDSSELVSVTSKFWATGTNSDVPSTTLARLKQIGPTVDLTTALAWTLTATHSNASGALVTACSGASIELKRA